MAGRRLPFWTSVKKLNAVQHCHHSLCRRRLSGMELVGWKCRYPGHSICDRTLAVSFFVVGWFVVAVVFCSLPACRLLSPPGLTPERGRGALTKRRRNACWCNIEARGQHGDEMACSRLMSASLGDGLAATGCYLQVGANGVGGDSGNVVAKTSICRPNTAPRALSQRRFQGRPTTVTPILRTKGSPRSPQVHQPTPDECLADVNGVQCSCVPVSTRPDH